MRIIVEVKQILDPRGLLVNRRAGKVFVNREEYMLNPADKNALEAGLRLKEQAGAGSEVVVVSAGPETCATGLREALAMGADQALRLADPCLASDGAVVARILLAALRKLGAFDVLLLGERAHDFGTGEMGPRLAAALGLPLVVHAHELTLAADGLEAVVRTGQGFARVATPLPAVITVDHGANVPRRAHAPTLMRAYQGGPLEYWDQPALALDPLVCSPRIARGEAETPPEPTQGRVTTSLGEVAAALRPFVNRGQE